MFTGIVEELGEVVAVEELPDAARLRLRGPLVTEGVKHGDSIAVNGVCLTVVESSDGEFTADVVAETLARTSLGVLTVGSRVNLERPMAVGERLTSTAPAPSRSAATTAGYGSTSRRSSPSTSSRRARSRSTASASPSSRRATPTSPSR